MVSPMPKPLKLKNFETTKPLEDEVYEHRLKKLQDKLMLIQTAYITQKRRAIVVLEGWDAAGKGGLIKRLTEPLDPRFVHVWPIAAPDDHERKRHYLYRFWTRLPGQGEVAVFDRSWYGRVLVERVEGFTEPARWKQAYDEINDFEDQLHDDGMRIVKLFLHITPKEQDKRLIERLEIPYKRWKTGFDDYRNRAKRKEYTKAIEEMFAHCSTKQAPWTVIPADDKKSARIQGLQTIVDCLGKSVDLSDPPLDRKLKALAEKELGVKLRF
jgi:AMP-polyphosphate phosphotransferase